jgi:hypothetical protein
MRKRTRRERAPAALNSAAQSLADRTQSGDYQVRNAPVSIWTKLDSE